MTTDLFPGKKLGGIISKELKDLFIHDRTLKVQGVEGSRV
jgi:hypothetical protein